MGIQKCTRDKQGFHRFTRACARGFLGVYKVSKKRLLQTYKRVYKGIQGITRVHMGIQEYTRVCRGIQVIKGVYN